MAVRIKTRLRIRRVYEPAEESDGMRVLVDRLWPRGLTKERAKVDLWLKDVAPGTELRKWFSHDPEKWVEFQKRYRAELRAKGEALGMLKKLAAKGTVTLVYAARDEKHNEAAVLQKILSRAS